MSLGRSPGVLVRGMRLTAEGFVDGWADLEGGVVRAAGFGNAPREADLRAVLVPAPVNAHTHVGDAALRGRLDPALGLDALVKPPHGRKHVLLRETPEPVLLAGMREALREIVASGARAAVDFREGGLPGVRLLRRASKEAGAHALALGRADAASPIEDVLVESDGVGIPAIGNLAEGEARRWATAARRARKLVALHASEGEREDVRAVVELAPHHVVHMTHGTREDFSALAEAGVLVVVCPRSNASLVRRLPDVAGMLRAGCRVALGTDNASLQDPNVWEEMAFLAKSGEGLRAWDVVRVGLLGWRAPGEEEPRGVVEGSRGPFVALAPSGTPEETVLSGAPKLLRAREGE